MPSKKKKSFGGTFFFIFFKKKILIFFRLHGSYEALKYGTSLDGLSDLTGGIGKKQACLKKYDQFILNVSCFVGKIS